MKAIRLNQAIRSDMIKSMREQYDQNNPPPSTLEERNAAQGRAARSIWDKFLGHYKTALEAVPAKFLNESNIVKVAIEEGGMKEVGIYDAAGIRATLPAIRNGSYDWHPVGILTADEYAAFVEHFEALKKEYTAWSEEKEALIAEATIIIDSIQTTKQLHEIWPEGCAYLPPFAADPSLGMQVPALHTSRLNKFLGLEGTELPASE